MFKRLLALSIGLGIAVFIVTEFGCGKKSPTESYPVDITVSFSGTDELIFLASYGNNSESHEIRCDTIPAEYSIQCKSKTDAVAASASFYPTHPEQTGTLTLKLLKGSETLDQASTSDPDAMISVEWYPGE